MARATKEQSAATAERILGCARRLFAERSYAAVGLDEIASIAGVTRGAVYHHYGSKLGVFRAVHAWAQSAVAATILQATSASTDPWEALEVGCRAFLEASVRDDIRQILLIDAPAVLGWDAWHHHDAQNSGQLLSDVLTDLAASRMIDIESVSACQALLSGALNEAALRAASLASARVGIDEAWPTFRRMLNALRR